MGLLAYASLCLFGLLLSSPFPGAEAKSCPTEWAEIQGNCYAYFAEEMSWAEAEIDCQSHGPGAHLASILSESETNLIASYILNSPFIKDRVWIGLHDPRKNGRWRWSDQSVYNYKAWVRGQPIRGEYCAELQSSAFKIWKNNKCQKDNAYICKQKL